MASTELLAWERQETDTDDSWVAFVAFRDMKAPRRLLTVAVNGSRLPTAKLSEWYRAHAWKERADAYDRHMDRVVLEEREALLRQTSKEISAEHMTMLHAARELVQRELDKWLQASRETEAQGLLKVSDVNRLLENVVKLDRLIRDQSTEQVTVEMDLSKLTPEELKQLRTLREKIEK